jgi:hypothetical protein
LISGGYGTRIVNAYPFNLYLMVVHVCRFTKMFDENTTCLYLGSIAMRWLAVRIDTLAGNVYTLECKADLEVFIPILLSDQ